MIAALAEAATMLARERGCRTVCLSGGSFQNHLLLSGLTQTLIRVGFRVHTNREVPLNDGGISLGQAVVAGTR